jgi:hypothetical protein
MTVANGNQIFIGYSQSNIFGVHRDPEYYIAAESFSFTPEIGEIERELLVPGQHHESIELLKGSYSCSGSIVFDLHAQEGIHLMKGVLGSITSTLLGSSVYKHNFLGDDSIPMSNGFSFLADLDLKTYLFSGVLITSAEISIELDNPAKITFNWIAKKWERSDDGTAGTSQGQNAISTPVTIVASTSDQIKLDIDGGGAVEVTIAAGTYTSSELETAINTAIKATSGLLDSDDVAEVACRIDSSDKVNFYTADKGTGASVAWTAGTNDAGALLGRGTPVESAGASSNATPSFSSVQPFIGHQIKIEQDGSSICVGKLTLSIDAGIIGRKCLGHKFIKTPVFEKRRLINLSFEKDYEDENAISAWENNSNVDIKIEGRTGTVAGGSYNYDLDVFLKRVRILNAPVPAPALGVLKQTVTAKAYKYDATYNDIRFDVQNLLTSI